MSEFLPGSSILSHLQRAYQLEGLQSQLPKNESMLLSRCVYSFLHIEVESDPYCKQVLECWMAEGNLPHCDIKSDIKTYTPAGLDTLAEALLGGFPCQASIPVWWIQNLLLRLNVSCSQGVSGAGDQNGLDDLRSGLLREIFRVGDGMNLFAAQEVGYNFAFNFAYLLCAIFHFELMSWLMSWVLSFQRH